MKRNWAATWIERLKLVHSVRGNWSEFHSHEIFSEFIHASRRDAKRRLFFVLVLLSANSLDPQQKPFQLSLPFPVVSTLSHTSVSRLFKFLWATQKDDFNYPKFHNPFPNRHLGGTMGTANNQNKWCRLQNMLPNSPYKNIVNLIINDDGGQTFLLLPRVSFDGRPEFC